MKSRPTCARCGKIISAQQTAARKGRLIWCRACADEIADEITARREDVADAEREQRWTQTGTP